MIHATDTLNAGFMKSDVSRFKLWNPDRPSTERSRKEVGARSLREWTIHFSELVDPVSLRKFFLIKRVSSEVNIAVSKMMTSKVTHCSLNSVLVHNS